MKWPLASILALLTVANGHACSMSWRSQDEVVLIALKSTSSNHIVFWGSVEGAELVYPEGAVFPPPPPEPQWSEDCPQSGPTTCVIAAGLGPRPRGPQPTDLILTWSIEETISGPAEPAFEDTYRYIGLVYSCDIRTPRLGERWLVVREPGSDEATQRYFGEEAEMIAVALRRRD